MGKQFAKEPLLFINQPTIQSPEAPMQHNFFTPKKEQIKKEDKDVYRNPSRVYKRKYFQEESKHLESRVSTEEGKHSEVKESEERGLEEGDSTETKEKGFKDMTLEEKIDYFRDTPIHTPQLKCEVITEDQKYRGIIIDYQDNHVFIRTGRRSMNNKVPFNDIKDIRMLGF